MPSPPMAWVEALSRLLRQPSVVPLSRGGDGRRWWKGCAARRLYGTASAFSERGLDVLAKTGTANQPAGGTLGVVVAAWPAGCANPRDGPGRTRCRRQGRRGPGGGRRRRAPRRAQRGAPAPLGAQRRAPRSPSARSAEPPVPPRERSRARPLGAQRRAPDLRVGTPRSGGGYTVEVYRARRLRRAGTGRRGRRRKPACGAGSAGRGGADVCRRQSRAASARRLRPLHADALPGAARTLRRRARRRVGHRRPGSARQRRARVGVLHGVVRRPHRASVGGLARRRRSAATCRRSRIGPAAASLDGRPRSPCRISNERSRLPAIADRSCGASRWMAAVHPGAWRACTSTG